MVILQTSVAHHLSEASVTKSACAR